MALRSCTAHAITYNDRLDPFCPQCVLGGCMDCKQVDGEPGKFGVPAPDETTLLERIRELERRLANA